MRRNFLERKFCRQERIFLKGNFFNQKTFSWEEVFLKKKSSWEKVSLKKRISWEEVSLKKEFSWEEVSLKKISSWEEVFLKKRIFLRGNFFYQKISHAKNCREVRIYSWNHSTLKRIPILIRIPVRMLCNFDHHTDHLRHLIVFSSTLTRRNIHLPFSSVFKIERKHAGKVKSKLKINRWN